MDSFRGQGSIQMLLTAEQDAQNIVTSARNLKLTRIKQAKEEADRELISYRSNVEVVEAEYQKKISETSESSGSTVKPLEKETEIKIKNLKQSASMVSKDVVSMLMKNVTTIKV